MTNKENAPSELPQQALMNKYLKWGGALATTVVAVLITPPIHFLIPGPGYNVKALVGIIMGVLLMVFISVGKEKTSWFTAVRTLGFLLGAISLLVFYLVLQADYVVTSNGEDWFTGTYTQDASNLRATELKNHGSYPGDAQLLHLKGGASNITNVWTRSSIIAIEAEFLVLYIIAAILFGMTIIGAFDFLQSKLASGGKQPAKKRPQRRRSPHPLKLKLARGPSPSKARLPAGTAPRKRATAAPRKRAATAPRVRAATAPRAKSATAPRAKTSAPTRAGAGTATRAPAGTSTRARAGTSTRGRAGTSTRAGAGTSTRARAGTSTRARAGTSTRAPAGTSTRAHGGTASIARAGTVTRARTGTAPRVRAKTSTRARVGTVARGRVGAASRARTRIRIGTHTRKPKTR